MPLRCSYSNLGWVSSLNISNLQLSWVYLPVFWNSTTINVISDSFDCPPFIESLEWTTNVLPKQELFISMLLAMDGLTLAKKG